MAQRQAELEALLSEQLAPLRGRYREVDIRLAAPTDVEVVPGAALLDPAELERRISTFTLVTQNVDGLHQRAGSDEVLELHGNILRSKCSWEGTMVDDYAPVEAPPPCPSCGAPLRPDVVWFGEGLPTGVFEAASEAARACDVFLSIGTSSLVYPAAALPFEALEKGAVLVEVNPDETPLSAYADHVLRGPAGEMLPRLVSAIL